MEKPNVIFLCTGNSARSQMAEGFLRYHGGKHFNVYSAGLEAKGMNPSTVRAMDEKGIDVRGQASENVQDYVGKMPFTYTITVCAHADENCPAAIWSGGEKLHWYFDDPAAATGSDEEKLAYFRIIRDQIEERILGWLGWLHRQGVVEAGA